jgi:hypothetical protein
MPAAVRQLTLPAQDGDTAPMPTSLNLRNTWWWRFL